MKIGGKFNIQAAHQLIPDPEGVYGPCSNMHGHSYNFEVLVKRPLDKHGWVLNFAELTRVVQEAVLNVCDHKVLNDVYPDIIPTAENLGLIWAKEIQKKLDKISSDIKLSQLRVYETVDCFAEIDQTDLTNY